jgi:hypothetical protein
MEAKRDSDHVSSSWHGTVVATGTGQVVAALPRWAADSLSFDDDSFFSFDDMYRDFQAMVRTIHSLRRRKNSRYSVARTN